MLRDAWGNRCGVSEALGGVGGGARGSAGDARGGGAARAPPIRVALVPLAGSGAEQRLSGACLEAACRVEDPEEGVEVGADADGGVLLYYTRHHAAKFAVRLMLHGARVELPMVVCVLPGPPHPQCCTFAGTVNAQLLPLPPAVATLLSAAPPTSPAAVPPSTAAAAAAAAASGVWLTTATEQATRSLLSDPDPHPSPDT